MNLDELRVAMNAYRKAVDQEARELKDSYLALEKLHSLYRELETEERALADRVVAEWLLSDDEGLRFDALVLVDDFKIVKAVSALRELSRRLGSTTTPGAPYEQQRIDRVIRELAS